MASETEDPELAAERLEAALERIAEAGARAQAAMVQAPAPMAEALDAGPAVGDADAAALIGELDTIIARLRAALGVGRA